MFGPFRIHQLTPYVLGPLVEQVSKARLAGRDIVDLSKVNPETPVPTAAVEALVQASLKPIHHRYSSSQGITRLREAACRWHAINFTGEGVELNVDTEVVVTLGTKEAIAHFLLAVLDPGDSVLVPSPTYPVHQAAISIAGGQTVLVPLGDMAGEDLAEELTEGNERFFVNLEQAMRTASSRPRVLLCSFPHNPTTCVVTQGFFQRLVDWARTERVIIVHDFAYAGLTYDGYLAPSILQVEGAKDVAIEFFSLSKMFGMAGWRLGFAVGSAELVGALKKIKSYLDFGAFQPLQIGAIQALQAKESPLVETREIYRARRNALVEGLCRLGWNVALPKATVFVWAKIPERFAKMGSLAFSQLLLEEAQVAVVPGVGFGEAGDAFIRFALVENESRIRKALAKIGEVLVVAILLLFLPYHSAAEGPAGSGSSGDCATAMIELKKGVVLSNGSSEEEEHYRKAVGLCPTLAEAHFGLGVNLTLQKRFDEALQAHERALKQREDGSFLLGYAYTTFLKSDLSGAEEVYKKIIQRDPVQYEAHQGLSAVYEKQGKLLEAEEEMRQAIQINSRDGICFYNLGVILEKQGRFEESVVSYESAVEKQPSNVGFLIRLARGYLHAGEKAKAMKVLNQATSFEPGSADAWVAQAELLEKEEKFKQAKDSFNRAIALRPDDASILVVSAPSLFALGEAEEALSRLRKAAQLSPNDSQVFNGLGWAYVRQQQTALAEEALRKAVLLNDKNASAHNNLGVLLEQQGKRDEATLHYRKAVEMDGKLESAAKNLKRITR